MKALWERMEPTIQSHGCLLRRLPYPYRAMLAICSDLDETPDRQVYWEIARFLNTTSTTSMGPGVGLEVGNSIYFDMPPEQFAYWNTDDGGRAMIRDLIRSGHIDCLHSYGDLATTRRHAGRALEELSRHDCHFAVWVDHGVAPSNFGADIMRGWGDVSGSDVYHADLTCGYGIRYLWRGRVTSVIGQDAPRSLAGIFHGRRPLRSARTVAKELAKGLLACLGSAKYAMHGPNHVLRPIRLRDGRPAWEFMRSNPYWEAVDRGETAEGLVDVLRRSMLDRLVARGGVCILYTHLGKIRSRRFDSRTCHALALLADYFQQGKILVTTTRRLLDYVHTLREVALRPTVEGQCLRIEITIPTAPPGPGADAEDCAGRLAGLTVYVSDPARTRLTVNGREVPELQCNDADHTGRRSVSLLWTRLKFPEP